MTDSESNPVPSPLPPHLSHLHLYGTASSAILSLLADSPALAAQLHPALPTIAAEVIHAARHEMARTVEDILARRTRALFLNARAAIEMAPQVAALLAQELNHDPAWQQSQLTAFTALAHQYLPTAA